MSPGEINELCEQGQGQLIRMNYLEAEALLEKAEAAAFAAGDWDSLSRLYMPLQEARRQKRIRCGEGQACLDLLAEGESDQVSGRRVVENYPHGQLLVAGWGSIEPALEVRRLAREHGLYVETFLGAVFPVTEGRAVVVVPLAGTPLPAADLRPMGQLREMLPPGCLIWRAEELPAGCQAGTAESYGRVLGMWEPLHLPLLRVADAMPIGREKIEAYRRTIEADYACELAHQNLSAAAREMLRARPAR